MNRSEYTTIRMSTAELEQINQLMSALHNVGLKIPISGVLRKMVLNYIDSLDFESVLDNPVLLFIDKDKMETIEVAL